MHSNYLLLASAILTSFVLTYMFIPSIIKVAIIKHLYDTPDERKSHVDVIPTLGGVGIFGGFIIGFCLFARFDMKSTEIKYVIAALSFMFMLGAKDDIVELVANKKFIGQIFAAAIIVILGDIRLTSLYGLFGISIISDATSYILSIITIVFIINAFNLVDGINLLAGSVGVVATTAFGTWFLVHDFFDYAILAAAMSGALFAFLKYNYSPARIFMGDSGSLSVGLLVAVLAIQFIEKNEFVLALSGSQHELIRITAAPAMAVAVLIIPLYDTLRVFTLRIAHKKSPFIADRNHIHHKLLDSGLSHLKATIMLVFVNVLFIIASYFLQFLGNMYLMIVQLAFATLLSLLLIFIKSKKKITANISEKKMEYVLEMDAS